MNDLIALSYLRIYHIFQYNFFCTEFYIIHQSDSGVPSAFQSIPNPANNNLHAKYSLIRSFHRNYVFPCSYLSISLFFDLVLAFAPSVPTRYHSLARQHRRSVSRRNTRIERDGERIMAYLKIFPIKVTDKKALQNQCPSFFLYIYFIIVGNNTFISIGFAT